MNPLYLLSLLTFSTYYITRVITHSYLLDKWRYWVVSKNGFLGYGVSCFFCISIWVSTFLYLPITSGVYELLLYSTAIAGISNVIYIYLHGEG
jgi:hypothetical protein